VGVLDEHELRKHLLTLVVREDVANHEHAVVVNADVDSPTAEPVARRNGVRKPVAARSHGSANDGGSYRLRVA
jgi:hypothetical protein